MTPYTKCAHALSHLRACVCVCLRCCSYDIKWVEACAEGIAKFEVQRGKSKPLFVLFRSGLELDRMANGANGLELARLVEKHKGEKKPQ